VPNLDQVGSNDQIAPPTQPKTASLIQGPAELLEYPIDHFDFYTESWGETVLIDQINFLKKTLASKTSKHER
jgi:hypothetical protein